ncbi:MAG: bifunctional DNA primase/polymerase [Alphaproteobacteria bacterium]|nr:bifunctional DNA primase/polymerase [Alphaproteobacteria bacterium]
MPGDTFSCLDAALDYARRGWSVVALVPRDKRPLVAWRELQERRAEAPEIEAWFARWPDANVGIVTGAISELVVLDVDPRHGGRESLAALVTEPAETLEVTTGGGGHHYYYRHPGGTVPGRVALRPGLDVRAEGGLVVAPPSIHPSGGAYSWRTGHGPDEAALAALPNWLRLLLGETAPPRGHPVRYWRALLAEGVGEGARNNTIASLAGHLFFHGADVEVATELLLCWNQARCRPPLAADEVVRTVASIARLHRRQA